MPDVGSLARLDGFMRCGIGCRQSQEQAWPQPNATGTSASNAWLREGTALPRHLPS